MSKQPNKDLVLYAVQSLDGKWFRRKGYGGTGDSWVDDFSKARIYQKIGHARAIVTWFANNWSDFGVPQLVKLSISTVEVIDETERVEQRNQKKTRARAKREQQRAEEDFERAQRQLASAQQEMTKAQSRRK